MGIEEQPNSSTTILQEESESGIMKLFFSSQQPLSYLFIFVFVSLTLVPETVQSIKCGVKKPGTRGQNRIINGHETEVNEWPWMASLRYSFRKRHFCGGSVIGRRWIITAAHCLVYKDGSVKRKAKDITIYLGAHKRQPMGTENVEVHKVRKYIIHERYSIREGKA